MFGKVITLNDLSKVLYQLQWAARMGFHSWILRTSTKSNEGLPCDEELLTTLRKYGYTWDEFDTFQIFNLNSHCSSALTGR